MNKRLRPLAQWLIKKAYGDEGYTLQPAITKGFVTITVGDDCKYVEMKCVGAGGEGGKGVAGGGVYTLPIAPIETNGIKGYCV